MDNSIFTKMKAKPGMTASIISPPPTYPDWGGFTDGQGKKSDFVHLFVSSQAEFAQRFENAADQVASGGLLWVSYPKGSKSQTYDINRDSLWNLVLPLGWHPVAQVALDDAWSAVRLKRNEPGVEYVHPKNVKA